MQALLSSKDRNAGSGNLEEYYLKELHAKDVLEHHVKHWESNTTRGSIIDSQSIHKLYLW